MRIFLDDEDDRLFFADAPTEIPLSSQVTEFNDGVLLMAELHSDNTLPDVIFLDLKMPLMDGFECLQDIRDVEEFKNIPVVIYSTSVHKLEVSRL